ncbi:MAG: hypothetical protein GX119_05755 [Syntrophomonadaceae bacterium]|jgi:hypothetical protein|nr:hypothetical protein [Syntrophomonadaceae bacterium]
MATRISWTTGPIASSSDMSSIRILGLNNTSYTRQVSVRLYDLSFTPKRQIFNNTYSLRPFETLTVNLDVSNLEAWEAQASAFSSSVRFYVTGRSSDGRNRPGTTVMNSELIRF